MDLLFIANSLGLGVGLAMDAFSVSLANGLREPRMSRQRMCAIAGVYAFFQYLMPITGWVCVRFIVDIFSYLERLIPWAALLMLLYLGGKMLWEGVQDRKAGPGEAGGQCLGPLELLVQGVATSIDALSVGFMIERYRFLSANAAAVMIGLVTFALCLGGLKIGRKAGTAMSWKASVLGGCILILIGLEIFLKGIV